jgi:preprotein translocase subunit SecF
MEILKAKTNVDFLGMSKYVIVCSLALAVASIYIWLQAGEAKYGIDYKGGHEIVVRVPGEVAKAGVIRKSLADAGFEGAIVQSFEQGSNEYSLRITSDKTSNEVRREVEEALNSGIDGKVEILKTDYVGPTIGKELRRDALIAIIIGLIGILVYVSFRFEFAFALGAVIALFHDVIVTMGVYLFCGQTVTMATLAAALTIVGYSVNDTIIIFDRMREELLKQKNYVLEDLMNYSINATLSRTIITNMLTFFSALALFLFGGGAIQDLSLFFVVGVVAGTYSTIFIASPVALAWADFQSKRDAKKAA